MVSMTKATRITVLLTSSGWLELNFVCKGPLRRLFVKTEKKINYIQTEGINTKNSVILLIPLLLAPVTVVERFLFKGPPTHLFLVEKRGGLKDMYFMYYVFISVFTMSYLL